jgi:cyclopropane-fatty-acyl-phospholipid synthase
MNEFVATGAAPSNTYGGFDRVLRSRLFASLESLHGRPLRIVDALGSRVAGDEHADAKPITIFVEDPGFYRAVAANGSVGAAEAYMDGLWRCDDLVGLIQVLVRNRDLLDRMETGMARLAGLAMRGLHALRRNTREGARRNIAAHYDLGNAFFELFLSPDLMYS